MQLSDLDLNKTYTYADYLQWTFEERLELIKGKIFKMTPAPAPMHQKISWNISGELYNYLKGKPCQAFSAPFDVRLPQNIPSGYNKEIYTVVQPDILVVCDAGKIDNKGCTGAPDIVIEILSPGNNKKELRNKYDVYEESCVKEYWIVSPQDKTFLQYTLTDAGRYQASRLMTVGDEVTTPVLPDFVLDLDIIFENIHPEL
ncbi:Uma2 family endonuclease [Mucilaginibacter sp. CSA2-8R]|uniref:Uma2 family endonuclease n=1 Tax=Mucilaginibacter sp. CSA2-8R TaxID=3141542 RepID=UPI00315D423D